MKDQILIIFAGLLGFVHTVVVNDDAKSVHAVLCGSVWQDTQETALRRDVAIDGLEGLGIDGIAVDPPVLGRVIATGVEDTKGDLVGAQGFAILKQVPRVEPIDGKPFGQVQAETQGEIIALDLRAEPWQVDLAFFRRMDDSVILFIIEIRYGQGDQIYTDMVAKETQIVLIDECSSCLHLDPLEWITHHLHEHSKVSQKLSVLLRLGVSC